MAIRKQPAIVAELGRPETPEETAARKAENSRKHRTNQTALNLVVATVASLAIVLFLVVVVVRPDQTSSRNVDYAAIAAEAASGEQLLAPTLPPGWYANDAHVGATAEVQTWYIGFVTPETQFIALEQGLDADATWLVTVLDKAKQTGTTTIDGLEWTIFDRRTVEDPGNFAYSMSTEADGSTVVLHGTASESEFELLATAISGELEAR